jgi:uncharacterized cupin superfamily protein
VTAANIHRPDFDDSRDEPGFRARRARIGHQAGTRRIGASLWEIDPGEAAYPYHAHLGEEELVFVLDGRPALRTPDGWRDVEPGEVLRFAPGDEGAHQLVNRSDAVVRFLAISTQDGPDIVLQPDSGKLGAYERLPEGGGRRFWFRGDDEVGYFEGETPPTA